MLRFVIFTVYLLCCGLGHRDGRQSTPRTEILYCTSTRRAPSRCAGETQTRKPPSQIQTLTTENQRDMLMRRACACALSPRSFLLLEHSLQSTPSPLCELASWPLLGACSMYFGELFLFLT